MRLASTLDIMPVVRDTDTGPVTRITLFGKPAVVEPGPQCHYVEASDPERAVPPHFHEVDQFQLFLDGDGRIGSTQIEPILVQYADAYTPYGPIVGKTAGYRFLTLRAQASSGAFFMPESRAERRRLGGRQRSGRHVPGAGQGGRWNAVIGPDTDGMAAFAADLAPLEKLPPPDGLPGAGRFYVVARGSMRHEGRDHPVLSTAFVEADAPCPVFEAGADGLTLIAVSFPS